MEGAVDRGKVSQVLTVRESSVHVDLVAAPGDAWSRQPSARWSAQRRAAGHIPSVVRALLVGYDEV